MKRKKVIEKLKKKIIKTSGIISMMCSNECGIAFLPKSGINKFSYEKEISRLIGYRQGLKEAVDMLEKEKDNSMLTEKGKPFPPPMSNRIKES